MKRLRRSRLLLISSIALLLYAAAQYTLANDYLQQQPYTVSTEKSFDDVIDDLKFAISESNFRLTSENRIGAAISERTGKTFPPAGSYTFAIWIMRASSLRPIRILY